MGKNLVVARVGEKSIHRNWLRGEAPNFDLVLLFYGKEVPKDWAEDGLETHIIPGSKWEGITFYLNNTQAWRDYDRVCFPDDDLLFDAALLNTFFYYAETLEFDLCQPALDFNSYFSHPITLQSPGFAVRFTNFVEIMFPCFSKRFLEVSYNLMAESPSGWGMDYYWAALLDKNNMNLPGIIDCAPITHTRPIGAAGNGCAPGHSPQDDFARFCERHNFKAPLPRVLGGLCFADGDPSKNKLLSCDTTPVELALLLIRDVFLQANMADNHKLNSILHTVASGKFL
jgi:hypothetical protein